MIKTIKTIKRIISVIIVLSLCTNISAAVVSDNDGSAFITKAEFDSLKNNFQSSIDQYNTSIDSKIDDAIAQYLSGIQISKRSMISNRYGDYELQSGQKFNLLKWTNSTSFNLNKCDRESNKKDYQNVWVELIVYMHGENADKSNGKNGIVRMRQYDASSSSQNRFEIDKFGRITSWGAYNHGFEAANTQTAVKNTAYNSIGTWIVITFTEFCSTARRPWLWKPRLNTSGTVNQYVEMTYSKSFETMPSATQTFDMTKVQIAPLSTTYEGRIGPQPDVSDTSNFTGVSGSSTSYGSRVLYYTDQVYLNTDELRNSMNTTMIGTGDWTTVPLSSASPRVFRGLEARWFDCAPYNDGKFACIYTAYGFDCSMKSGIPITSKQTISDEDKIIIQVENAQSNGYLIPYLAKSPSETWGGAKSNYKISKYQVTSNTKKEIEITVDSEGEYYLFVVWLPSTACVLPDLTVYIETTT